MWLSGDLKLMCTYRSTTVPLVSFIPVNGGTKDKKGIPSSASIIEDVERALEVLEIFFRTNSAAVEVHADRNGHRRKDVGEG